MAEVVFYLIQTQIRLLDLACRICRKSLATGQTPLLVLFDQQAVLQQFDALLWEFDATSFIPHDIDDATSPICLSLTIPAQFRGSCLNLGQQLLNYPDFQRILEIVDNTDDAKVQARERFKAYRRLGSEPVIHQM